MNALRNISLVGPVEFQSPANSLHTRYDGDRKYFERRGFRNRTLALRVDYRGPHDRHWCLVVRLAAGVHLVLPIYQGDVFFALERGYEYALATTDHEILLIVERIRQMGRSSGP